MNNKPFAFWVPVDLTKSIETGEGIRPVCGVISTEDRDLDGERIMEQFSDYGPMLHQMGKNLSAALVDRLDFDRFSTRQGYLKYEHFSGECPTCHAGETANIIGIPTRIEKGITYRDPIAKAIKTGTGIWGELFAPGLSKSADAAWDLMQAIRKSGFDRRLGYSIEGAYVGAPSLDATQKACLVTNVVLTTKPVNSWTWAEMGKSMLTEMHKALVAGPGTTDSSQMAGGEALREQSLYPNRIAKRQPMQKDPHEGEELDEKGALEHLVKCLGYPMARAKEVVIRTFNITD